ncbi:MAG TPA: hypothetical protein VFF06_19745 [Polyangia bacterium]|nr:hypothetical protein [Polyangia bacterium]
MTHGSRKHRKRGSRRSTEPEATRVAKEVLARPKRRKAVRARRAQPSHGSGPSTRAASREVPPVAQRPSFIRGIFRIVRNLLDRG